MEQVQLGDIHSNGFLYKEYDPNTVILHRLESLDVYPNKNIKDSLVGTDLHYFIKDYYLSLWKTWGLFIENVTFTSRVLIPGHSVELHSDMSTSQYKAIVFCPQDEYEGAEFVYGNKNGELEYIKPKFGDIMFCRTGHDELVHGFTELKSKEPIFYLEIYGGLDLKKPIEDLYHEGYEISEVELT